MSLGFCGWFTFSLVRMVWDSVFAVKKMLSFSSLSVSSAFLPTACRSESSALDQSQAEYLNLIRITRKLVERQKWAEPSIKASKGDKMRRFK